MKLNYLPPGWSACNERKELVYEYAEPEPQVFSAHYVVCNVCDGRGSHVNRAIDGNGISAQEFADDPDFAEAYFDGVYDVVCEACGGLRVCLEPDSKEGKDLFAECWEEELDYRRLVAAELRMGC